MKKSLLPDAAPKAGPEVADVAADEEVGAPKLNPVFAEEAPVVAALLPKFRVRPEAR